jgi:hypothetical protein
MPKKICYRSQYDERYQDRLLQDLYFIDVAKMTINIELFYLIISGYMSQHGTICSFVGIMAGVEVICLCIRL